MFFRISSPAYLYFLPALLAAFFIFIRKERRLQAELNDLVIFEDEKKAYALSHSLSAVFFLVFFLFSVLSLSEIYIGRKTVRTKKSASLLSVVADVSYSMRAKDTVSSKSRLDALKAFILELLEPLHVRTALIAVKGDALCLVPHTFDTNALQNTLLSLDPLIMTTKGSAIGNGILCALTQAKNAKNFSHIIWLLTDGGETDDSLLPALLEAKKANTKVFIVGFGNEKESEVLSGDGKTKVMTKLNKAHLLSVVSEANRGLKLPLFFFVDSNEKNAPKTLLSALALKGTFFEKEEIPREISPFFLSFAFICFILSIACRYEADGRK